MDQLLQNPSKIFIPTLLMNFAAHRESLVRVLEQAFIEKDFYIYQFNGIMGNITACNNLSFCDDELPDE